MSRKISRRDFLAQMARWGITGMGLALGSHVLLSCSKEDQPAINISSFQNKPNGFVAYSNKSLGYYFFVIQQEAINRAVEARGWGFKATIADMDPGKQFVQFEDSLSQKPLAIINDPVNSEGFTNSIERANSHGIPVGIIDNPISSGDVAITVTVDNYKAGQMAAQKVIEGLTVKYGEPRGIILNCYGPLKALAFQLRKEGFETEVSKYEKITLLSIPTEGDMTNAHRASIYTLQKYPDLDAVHVASETPARGTYQALKERGLLHPVGSDRHVIFVTIDGEPIAHEWINEEILDASISQDPIAYGEICVEMLDNYSLKGLKVPLGEYSNSKYYWEKAKIIGSPTGPSMVLPPFELNKKNIKDKRLWGNIAFNDWGIKYL